jgi:hypothetical protein
MGMMVTVGKMVRVASVEDRADLERADHADRVVKTALRRVGRFASFV